MNSDCSVMLTVKSHISVNGNTKLERFSACRWHRGAEISSTLFCFLLLLIRDLSLYVTKVIFHIFY